ncbi:MAG: hypothetical protein MRY21_00370 [Simkaniaceae bacterium]|nr:hypothetical protein [Simkaniaceae bacterium]
MCKILNIYSSQQVKSDCQMRWGTSLGKIAQLAWGKRYHQFEGGVTYREEGDELCLCGRAILSIIAIAILPITLLGMILTAVSKSHRQIRQLHAMKGS